MTFMKIRIACIIILIGFSVSLSAQDNKKVHQTIKYTIGHYETIYSKILNEKRTVLIHLPDDYNTSIKKYPLLYILDGEDARRLNLSIEAISFYSGMRRLPKMIVIGILNTDRTRDVTPRKVLQRKNSGGGDAFLNFIISELNTYIENKYRTARYRILFGGSSAGMFTIYTLVNRPESFNTYIASRPAMNSTENYTWDSNIIFREARKLFKSRSSLKKTLFVDYGGQESGLHDPAPIIKLSGIFKSEAPPDFRWEIMQMGESGYRSAESLKEGLLTIFNDWYYPMDSLYTRGISAGEKHGEKLSKQYDYSIGLEDILDESYLIQVGYYFLENERLEEAITLFKYAIKAHPDSWNAYDSLAEAYMKNGKKEKAIQNFQHSLKLNPGNTNAVQMLKQLKLMDN
ncbi:MAG: tetratricopeptide repeat protein [Calditrichia bacterium]|nr:tetratricopeptide repeat protein [Calditrichia bacterium]